MSQHVIHPREEWIDPRGPAWEGFPSSNGSPYKCPAFRGWANIRDIVIHYPGADWADMDFTNDGRIDLNDDIAQIRVQHAHYARNRKYSLGYCYLIGQTGGIWESRGTRNTNAANLGQANKGTTGWNNYSISIQLIVDAANPGTQKQIASVNWLLDEMTRRKGSRLNLRYHGQGQSTACCGAGIIAQINRGIIGFDKSNTTPPPKPPQPEPKPPTPAGPGFTGAPGRTDMTGILIEYGEGKNGQPTSSWYHALLWGGNGIEHLSSGHSVEALKSVNAPRISVDAVNPGVGDNFLKALIEDNGTYGPSPYGPGSPSVNPMLDGVWVANSRG